jgi:hypothetical protein
MSEFWIKRKGDDNWHKLPDCQAVLCQDEHGKTIFEAGSKEDIFDLGLTEEDKSLLRVMRIAESVDSG